MKYARKVDSRVERLKELKADLALCRDAMRDIYAALPTLRSRARVLAISAPLVTSALRTLRTYVVGRGRLIKQQPPESV